MLSLSGSPVYNSGPGNIKGCMNLHSATRWRFSPYIKPTPAIFLPGSPMFNPGFLVAQSLFLIGKEINLPVQQAELRIQTQNTVFTV